MVTLRERAHTVKSDDPAMPQARRYPELSVVRALDGEPPSVLEIKIFQNGRRRLFPAGRLRSLADPRAS